MTIIHHVIASAPPLAMTRDAGPAGRTAVSTTAAALPVIATAPMGRIIGAASVLVPDSAVNPPDATSQSVVAAQLMDSRPPLFKGRAAAMQSNTPSEEIAALYRRGRVLQLPTPVPTAPILRHA